MYSSANIAMYFDFMFSTLLIYYFVQAILKTLDRISSLDRLGVSGHCFTLILSRVYFKRMVITPKHLVMFTLLIWLLVLPKYISSQNAHMTWTAIVLMVTVLPLSVVKLRSVK